MFKHWFKTVLALFVMLSSVATLAAEAPEAKPSAPISNGSRVEIKGKGFTIVPPKGWEVHTDIPGVSLLFQIPKSEGLKYQRNITVRYGQGEKTMDDYTADEYQNLILQNRSKIFGNMKNYRMRNRAEVELANGAPGILFYAEFDFEDLPMMEMHLLTSSKTGHFLMTYTDLAEYFNPDSNTPYLQEAYNSLISAKVQHPAGSRFGFIGKWGIALAVLFVFFMGLRVFSSGRTSRDMREEHSEFMSDDKDESGVSAISDVSMMGEMSDSPQSLKSSRRAKSIKKSRIEAEEQSHLESDEDMDYMAVSAEAVDEEADMGMSGISWHKTQSVARKLADKRKLPALPKKKVVNQDFDDFDDDLDFESDD